MIVMYILAFLSLLSISYFTLSGVFGLALFGDDFLTIWRYLYSVGGPHPRPEWNYLTYFLTPYGPQDTITGLLYRAFGFSSVYYHLTSYIFRIIAAISLLPVSYYLTKSKLAAFFATLFFSITVIGFDTTNWVFNMTSYISITFFNLFLYYFLKFKENKKIKLLIISGLFFYLTFIWSPIRMTGLLPFSLLFILFWVLQDQSLKSVKWAGLGLLSIISIILFIGISGHSTGPSTDLSSRFIQGSSMTWQMLSRGQFDFIFYPILTVGSMFFPDLIVSQHYQITSKLNLFFELSPTFLVFLLILFVLKRNISTLSKKFLKYTALGGFIWLILTILIHAGNINTLSDPNRISLLLIGGFVLLLSISLFIQHLHENKILNAIFISIVWSLASFLPAWYWIPNTIYPTTYRYLIVSAVGVALFLSVIIGLGKHTKQRIFLFCLASFFLVLQIISTKIYIKQLENLHSNKLTNKIWSQMPYIPEMGKTEQPLVFYFEGTERGILHNVLMFNFDYRNALLYNIWDDKIPVVMDDWKNIISAVTDGKSFAPYGRSLKPVPIDHIYAFRLEGSDQLINMTDLARQELEKTTQKK